MVHHRFDLEAFDDDEGVRRKSGGGTGGGLDRMSRALQIPPTEVFEILTQHRRVLAGWSKMGGPLTNLVLFFSDTRLGPLLPALRFWWGAALLRKVAQLLRVSYRFGALMTSMCRAYDGVEVSKGPGSQQKRTAVDHL